MREDFGAGSTVQWDFWYDEFHYILSGKAELTYSLQYTAYTETKKLTVEAGHLYLIPRGAHMEWKVDPGANLRKICVIMPCPPPRPLDAMAPGSVEELT